MKLPKTYGFLKKELNTIEKSLNESIQADHPILRKASTELLSAGGKRIRPVFVLLAGRLGNHQIDYIKTVAVSLELIHMATLVHDDVIDNAELRRGKPTIKQLYGNRVAMYTGDYILARALEVITTVNNPDIHRILSKTLVEVSIGEIEQLKDRYNWNQNFRDYLRRIKRKTALLIATSCQLGAIAAGVQYKESRKLYKYGYYVGMSYQIIDDILDFTASSKQLGKPAGNDLRQGNITLPILIAMQDQSFSQLIKSAFKTEDISETVMKEVLERLNQSEAIEKSYEVSNLYLQKALKVLDELPDFDSKRTLADIASYLGKRRS
jgi:heptaprenyl diphosphate synthase